MLQALRDLGGGSESTLTQAFIGEAIKAARIIRDKSPHHLSMYISIVVNQLFLRGAEGRRLLAEADRVGRKLMKRATRDHDEGAPGTILEYGWAMIRKLHPRSPGALKYWGRPQHKPPADAPGVNSRHAVCAVGRGCLIPMQGLC